MLSNEISFYETTLRDGHEWAVFSLRVGPRADDSDGPILLQIYSSYGQFAHWWHAPGGGWRDFLKGLNRHYAMGKLVADHSGLEVFCIETAEKTLRRRVIEARREGAIIGGRPARSKVVDKVVARECWQQAEGVIEAEPTSVDHFWSLVFHTQDLSQLFDCCDLAKTTVEAPQIIAFWDRLWKPFIDGLDNLSALSSSARLEARKLVWEDHPENTESWQAVRAITPFGIIYTVGIQGADEDEGCWTFCTRTSMSFNSEHRTPSDTGLRWGAHRDGRHVEALKAVCQENYDALVSELAEQPAQCPSQRLDELTASESGWWAGIIDEHYSVGPCATREEALQEAQRTDLGYEPATKDGEDEAPPQLLFSVAFCTTKPLKLSNFFDAKDWIEDREEAAAFDHMGEGGDELFACTQDQAADLQTRVRAAIDGWQADHGLSFRPWIFAEVSEREDLALPILPVQNKGAQDD